VKFLVPLADIVKVVDVAWDVNKSPFIPDVPEVPEVPDEPPLPAAPDVPVTPDVPEVPDEPADICDCKKSRLVSISNAVNGEPFVSLLTNAIIYILLL
jgi:hypothetical protein